jgi:hypothetical protein
MENDRHYNFLSGLTSALFWVKLLSALALLVVGCFAAYYIITIAVRLLLEKELFPLVQIITEHNPEGILFKINTDVLSLSTTFCAYFVIIIILSIVLNITVRIIKLGLDMIRLDVKYCLEMVIRERDKIRKEKDPGIYNS